MALTVAGLVAAGGAAALLLRDTASSEAPRFIVVRGNEDAVEKLPTPTQPVPPAPTPQPQPDATEAAARPAVSAAPRPRIPEDAADALARAFNRQKKPVVRCFGRLASGVAEGTTLSLRVALAAGGRVQEVTISPPGVVSGELAECIREAVNAMRFTAQVEAVAFRVPLIARRAGTE
jgi:hypothetical protein